MAPIEQQTYLFGVQVRKRIVNSGKVYTGPIESLFPERKENIGLVDQQRPKYRVDTTGEGIEGALEKRVLEPETKVGVYMSDWKRLGAAEVTLPSWIPGIKRRLVKV
ncbi:MAG TPA: hypothetical protein VLE91_01180 [Candidatus Saccharimonadales bacterium]|nr:hypothetical protein [Candidatus Saccharimonadales bacterium]